MDTKRVGYTVVDLSQWGRKNTLKHFSLLLNAPLARPFNWILLY